MGRIAYNHSNSYSKNARICVGVKPLQIEIDSNVEISANWMRMRYRIQFFKRNMLDGCTDGTVVRIAAPIRDHEQTQDGLKSLCIRAAIRGYEWTR